MTPTLSSEADVKREVKKLLKTWGWFYFMPQAGQYGAAGIPDFICCKFGLMLAIETKFGYGKPTPLQQERMKEIREAGGIAVWVNENKLVQLELLLATLDRKYNEVA